jgi:membrane-bound serine protease (ClpP class)
LIGIAWPAPARAASFVHIRVSDVINPVKERYLRRALERAEQEQAVLVLISLDTPGGLVSSTEKITSALVNARVPIVGFVEPSSAQATSAGAFILLATDVAAMAPHTRFGAAHPVGAEGRDLGKAMDEKATNSLASLAKSLAVRRGRPAPLAEAMVRESASFTADEAKRAGAIEIVAKDVPDLLRQLDGRELDFQGKKLSLRTRELSAIEVELSWSERLLDTIADPTIASMLLTLGMLGILYELASPGIGAAGIVGVISLLTGLAALSVLPLELGGLLLLLVGFVAIGIEVKVQTHGVLAAGGVASLVVGALLLVDRSSYFGAAQLVDWRLLLPFIAGATAMVVLLARIAVRSQKQRFQTGLESLVGRHGRAKTAFVPEADAYVGSVLVDGARWAAVSSEPLSSEDQIVVVNVLSEPTRLGVERSEKGAD